MTDITQEKYEQLQKQYDELRIQFKRQKRRIRNINRNKYNLLREEAAKSNLIKEFRKKTSNQISNLNNKIREQAQKIEDIQEEIGEEERIDLAKGTLDIIYEEIDSLSDEVENPSELKKIFKDIYMEAITQ